MADVTITYTSVTQLADSIGSKAQDCEKMVRDLETIKDQLLGVWIGSAQKEFAEAFQNQRFEFKRINNGLDDYKPKILKATNDHSSADQISAGSFKKL